MFREMRRIKQQIGEDECVRVLIEQKRGVLSVLGDEGYPYGIPLDHWYCEEDGNLYFHCAKSGHKIDAIKACDKVSYCVFDEGVREGDDWPLHFNSVIVFGRMSIAEDDDLKRKICSRLFYKFSSDEKDLAREMASSFANVCCLKLEIEHMTGKRVKES